MPSSRSFSIGLRLTAAVGAAIATIASAALAHAGPADPVAAQQSSIRSFSGCYDVSYDFKETEALQPGYQLKKPYHTSGVETVIVDEDRPGHIALQHILTVEDMVIKHWRQEWTYEQQTVFDYKNGGIWEKRALTPAEATGRWVQRVLQVDDSPRYECAAPWTMTEASPYWRCEAWSPLPRRESGRSDYNVLSRVNRQILTADGWNHEEHNTKIMVDEKGTVQPLVKEEGLNSYKRTDSSRCDKAVQFWKENSTVWHAINAAWEKVYASETHLEFKEKGRVPLMRMLGLSADDSLKNKTTSEEIERKAEDLIRSYL
jgi:hypothetical protein